jgi:hypothetical protein
MKPIRRETLPKDPPNSHYVEATGPEGLVWVEKIDEPFQLDDDLPGVAPSGWIVWDERRGFWTVDLDTFEADYQMAIGPSTLDSDGVL